MSSEKNLFAMGRNRMTLGFFLWSVSLFFPLVYGWVRTPSIHRSWQGRASRAPRAVPASDPAEEELRGLYPAREALLNGSLPVGDGLHVLRYQVYGSEAANESAPVALFLHGGPGAGCFPNHARFFDPERYCRVVLLDQRGCGGSTPAGCLVNQTLNDLVGDLEELKNHLGVLRWDVVLGGSWGTTLALAYAQTHPASVGAMVLRGVCLFRPQEIDWLFSSGGGAAAKHPEAWVSFARAVGVDPDGDENAYPRRVLHEYYQRLLAPEREEDRTAAARSWMQWEFLNSVAYKIPPSVDRTNPNATMKAIRSWKPPSVCPVAVHSPTSGLTHSSQTSWTYQTPSGKPLPSIAANQELQQDSRIHPISSIPGRLRKDISANFLHDSEPREPWPLIGYDSDALTTTNTSRLPVQPMLTCYYSTNDDFCRNYEKLLDPHRMQQVAAIPTVMVQGGSDEICPPDSALDLLEAWEAVASRESDLPELRIPLHAGHSMYDPLITNELVRATDRLADFHRDSAGVVMKAEDTKTVSASTAAGAPPTTVGR